MGAITPENVSAKETVPVVTEVHPQSAEDKLLINGKQFEVTEENRTELLALQSLAKREQGHGQWVK